MLSVNTLKQMGIGYDCCRVISAAEKPLKCIPVVS